MKHKKKAKKKLKNNLLVQLLVVGMCIWVLAYSIKNQPGHVQPKRTKYYDAIQAKLSQRKSNDVTEKIQRQFSAWDGSHYHLERLIKKQLKSPSSYEHVKTIHWKFKDYIIVKTTYRAKNSFNATVLESISAKYSFDGNLIEVL